MFMELGRKSSKGCVVVLVCSIVVLLAVLLTMILLKDGGGGKPEFIKDAEEKLDEMEKPGDKAVRDKYDIEQTVMALYSIEKALKESSSFEDMTEFIVSSQSEHVAHDVRLLRAKFFNAYKNLVEARDRIAEMESLYKTTSGAMLDLLSITGGSLVPVLDADREQAKRIWQKRIEEANLKRDMKRRLDENSSEILAVLFEYSAVSAKYYSEWDRLCAARDRAYLAFYERDWAEMSKSARSAREVFRHDEESSILLCVSLLEGGAELGQAEAASTMEEMLESSNGQSAPAYLLRGVKRFKDGDIEGAVLDFDQAAAYYPRQGEKIENRLDLYRKRAFLNRSKEGRVIIGCYRGIMSGAGYFSPDFQKARLLLAKGEREKAKQKIFEHFFRRRLQGQWDKVLNDFLFCRDFLGTDMREILVSERYNIAIEQSWMSGSPAVTLKNNDEKTLHNATLLVCVRFTDMMKGDYISFPVGNSAAAIPGLQSASFGKIDIKEESVRSLGMEKKWKDAVEYGAVLISDELITWAEPEPVCEKPGNDGVEGEQKGKIKEIFDDAVEKIIGK